MPQQVRLVNMHNLGLVNSPLCRAYEYDEETIEHILCNSATLGNARVDVW